MVAFLTFDEKVVSVIEADLKLDRNKIFIVPGNHDIVRGMDDEFDEKGLASVLMDTPAVNKFINGGKSKGRKRTEPFNNYLKSFYKNQHPDSIITDYQSSFKIDSVYGKVGITCFNSAWRCYSNEDKAQILLGERQITDARSHIADCPIRIAALHHPLDWFMDFEVPVVQAFISKDYHMLFCGHVHQGSAWSKSDVYGSVLTSVAPSNWTYNIRSDSRANANGYSIIDYDLATKSATIHHRRYCYLKEKYDPNADLGDDLGMKTYQIPSPEELKSKMVEIETADRIKAIHFDIINNNLLSSYTDTKAPKTINEIFVLPQILNKVDYSDKSEDVVEYDLQRLCELNDNAILFGIKESGKTILLDKLLCDFVDNVQIFSKIPVLIDFEELGNKDYQTMISQFLGIGILDVDSFLKQHKTVLLIDNIKFGAADVHKLKKLVKLLDNYEFLQVLATSLHVVEGEIPIEFLENPYLKDSLQLTIKSLKTKQIRALTEKWFSKHEVLSEPVKIEKLLDIILPLNLPRTPLAISMFLWIIEQQENYKPINQASMLENFVEKLFQKQSKSEIYSETFDYRNKERLLADIAYAMYQKALPNYRILYQDVLSYVGERLALKKFEYPTSEKVLSHFLAKGLLVKELDGVDTYIRFRFSCFLQYFLMKKLEFDPSFREHVFDESNYLHFCNEIDYFTGIKRDKADVLTMLIERMISAYSEVNSKINGLVHKYDTVFDVKKSMTSSLDGKYIENLKNAGKPTDKEMDSLTDEMLEKAVPEKGIEIKKQNIDKIVELERLWVLSSKVLKNTEETDIPGLKDSAYKQILLCSMAFSNIYKVMLQEYLNKNGDKLPSENKEKYSLINKALPLLHQLVLHTTMGTAKLSQVIREKIDADQTTLDISDFERYISVFLYADIRGTDYLSHIKKFIKSIKHQYIYDMTLFKLISYYHLRSKTKETDLIYEEMIAELITRSKKLSKDQKSGIMLQYREKKKKQPIGQ